MCYKQERDYKKVIFVLCVPGEDEEKAGHPAAGETGIKLNQILVHLNSGKPEIFPYLDKSHYSITNSYDKPIYPNNNLITTNFQSCGGSIIRVSGWRIEHGKESHSISKRSLNT